MEPSGLAELAIGLGASGNYQLTVFTSVYVLVTFRVWDVRAGLGPGTPLVGKTAGPKSLPTYSPGGRAHTLPKQGSAPNEPPGSAVINANGVGRFGLEADRRMKQWRWKGFGPSMES